MVRYTPIIKSSGAQKRINTGVELNAAEILKRRYTRDEISREEYLQASETLHASTR